IGRRGRLIAGARAAASRGFEDFDRRSRIRDIRGKRMARRKPRPTIREENERALLEAAESIFADRGFAGATTSAIAGRAGVPKANLHYYFSTKEGLYRSVIERVLTAWLAAASSFDASDDPRRALSAYISAKMDLAREMPLASRIWSAEIMRGAPMI